jgi:hypothetical protein
MRFPPHPQAALVVMSLITVSCTGAPDGTGDGDETGESGETSDCPVLVELPAPVSLDGCSMSPGELYDCRVRHAVIECPSVQGLRVAATETGAMLLTTTESGAWLFHSTPQGFEIEPLAAEFVDSDVLLSQSDNGEIGFVTSGFFPARAPDYSIRTDEGWIVEHAISEPSYPQDFELDAAGNPIIWFVDTQSFKLHRLTRNGPEDWTVEPVADAGSLDRYNLAPDDTQLHYYYEIAGTSHYQLAVEDGDSLSPLSEPGLGRPHYLPVPPPRPASSVPGPRALVGQEWSGGVRLLGSNGFVVEIPNTEPIVATCSKPPFNCVGECHETGAGKPPQRFGVARAPDGSVWIGWETVIHDHWVTYGKTCDEPGGVGCMCVETGTTNSNDRSEFHLARVADGEVEEIASMEIAPIFGPSAQGSIDLRAFDDRLAVGLWTLSPGGVILHLLDIDISL